MSLGTNEKSLYEDNKRRKLLCSLEDVHSDDVNDFSSEEILLHYKKLRKEKKDLQRKYEVQEKKIQHLQKINREQLEFSRQAYLPFCCVNEKGIIKEWNRALSNISGIPFESAINQNIKTLAELVNTRDGQHENLLDKIEHILSSDIDSPLDYNYVEKIRNFTTGEIVYVRILLQAIIFPLNKYVSILIEDITREKLLEKELEQYSERIENILAENSAHLFHLTKYVDDISNNSSDLVLQIEIVTDDGGFKLLHLNNAAKRFYHISSIPKNIFFDVFNFLPGVPDFNIDNYKGIENGLVFHSKTKDGCRHWETYLYSISNNDNVNRLLFISREVTDQFEKEELSFVLKSSIDSWPSPYWVCNEKKEFIIQNSECEAAWGNLIGQVFSYEVFPEKAREGIRIGLDKVFEGESFTMQFKMNTLAGVSFVLLKLTPMKRESGNIKGFSGLVYDITERKELEQKVISSVIQTEEKERLYFSQELHDSVNPLLSAASIYVDWLEKPNKNISQEEIIGDLKKILQEANASSREIAHKLSPHILSKAGLDGAVKMYSERIQKSSSIQIDVESKMDKRPVEFVEIALYRVVCECVNNTVKHAKAKNIKIYIVSDQDDIIINYADDGKGFDINEVLGSQKGIGLLSIKNRIDYINGVVYIKSAQGEGFEMEIKVCNSCE